MREREMIGKRTITPEEAERALAARMDMRRAAAAEERRRKTAGGHGPSSCKKLESNPRA
jgi:hypothetical protein